LRFFDFAVLAGFAAVVGLAVEFGFAVIFVVPTQIPTVSD